MKTYNVIIDMTESFLCPIEAESEEKALEKAEGVSPSENNVPYYSEANVIGVRGDDYIINQSKNYVQAAEETMEALESDVLVVETVCDLLELLSRHEIWVRVAGDTSLSKFINTDKAETDAFKLRQEG